MVQQRALLQIVGAGPGDPELISVKGLKALQQADVILYDALVAPALLEKVKTSCKKIFVGKRRGRAEFTQGEINHLLVYYGQRYNRVVRLKGGDPYVFGRGHEEMEYLLTQGIHAEVIPGISSALAAPLAAGIPLTKRSVNESFWVITGTVSDGTMSQDLTFAAQSSATIIVLMGIAHLENIAELVSKLRSPFEPMAIIQRATFNDQKTVKSVAINIVKEAKAENIITPALIVIGKVIEEALVAEAVMHYRNSHPNSNDFTLLR